MSKLIHRAEKLVKALNESSVEQDAPVTKAYRELSAELRSRTKYSAKPRQNKIPSHDH